MTIHEIDAEISPEAAPEPGVWVWNTDDDHATDDDSPDFERK